MTSDLSCILGRSKLSILYPVMKSGSSSRTNLVRPSIISLSEPVNSCSDLDPFLSTTAAAQSILFVDMLVSRSNEKDTNGAGNVSVFSRSSRLHEITMSTGYRPAPPAAIIAFSESASEVLSSFLESSGALFPDHKTLPPAEMCGPRSRSSINRLTKSMSALVISQLSSFFRRFLTE